MTVELSKEARKLGAALVKRHGELCRLRDAFYIRGSSPHEDRAAAEAARELEREEETLKHYRTAAYRPTSEALAKAGAREVAALKRIEACRALLKAAGLPIPEPRLQRATFDGSLVPKGVEVVRAPGQAPRRFS